ncbi:MAG: SUMF1/EgtB/PvdO family nonheme iron enzyme [Gemmataceae bacterium]|nr:SUMF1/EgtB/PvdO family nonheme iron enzyme [Gemmataceae bacterium]
MGTKEALFAALRESPGDELAWMALADWHEEEGRDGHAEQVRLMTWLRGNLDAPDRAEREGRLRDLIAGGLVPDWPSLEIRLNRTTLLEAMLVPPGEFRMGSDARPWARGDEGPAHVVRMTRPYWIGRFPVTQRQWRALTRASPSQHACPDCPVERTNWQDCAAFCERLSEHSGRRVRLPTEAEWEYACRAGTSTEYHTGDGEGAMRLAGCCESEATRPVGEGLPNGFGLYDMHGNVWEWMADAYGAHPRKGGPRTNPKRLRASHYRVSKGGSYSNTADCCRSSGRIGFAAGGRNTFIGCRVVVEHGRA